MTTIKSYNKRLEAMSSERSTFVPLWADLSDYHLAHRGRFLVTDNNKGARRDTKQLNNTSRMANRTLASGMMAGITSPARPWFRLSTPDPKLREVPAVREWLHAVQTTMYAIYSQSNTYNSLSTLYSELGVFGTSTMGVYSDFNNVIHCQPYTIGSYTLSLDGRNSVDSFYREYQKTVGGIVKEFGINNVSDAVKRQWDNGNTEAKVDVVHVVEPNDDRDMSSPLASNKKIRSVTYEKGQQTSKSNTFLKQSGFDIDPILSPRWDVTGEDIYATDCPGMTALGDTKLLQLGERRTYQAVDVVVKPPLTGPSNIVSKIQSGGLKPGDVIANDAPGGGLRSIYDFRPDIAAIGMLTDKVEFRVKRAFYEDLFLMLANSDRRQITAREVAEKHEEKLLMLGPVLERLHSELLDPLIDITFHHAQAAGILPPPPPELENVDLRVEYVSVLAQAQRMVSVGAINQMADFVGNVAGIWPEARHKFNALQAVDEYAEALGVAPAIIRDDKTVREMVQQEQQAAQAQQAAEMAQQAATTAKTASETSMDDGNALTTTLRNAGLM
jgi:hypothetical protein